MHRRFYGKTLKATIINVIVALFITAMILGAIYLIAGKQIKETVSIIGKIEIEERNRVPAKEITLTEEKRLDNYPEYGTEYATIEIPKINRKLPLFFGDTLDILKNGVGHFGGSYFPGEGGTVLLMGHNSENIFRRFSELEKGNEIIITTSYGTFKYKIYDMQIVNEDNFYDKVKIQNEKEILAVYTCYPFANIGYTKQRYVVFAEPVNEEEK